MFISKSNIFSMTLAAIFGLFPSHRKLHNMLFMSSRKFSGTDRMLAGYTIKDTAKELITVTFPFRESFIFYHCFKMFSLAFNLG